MQNSNAPEHYPKAPVIEAVIALHFERALPIRSLEKFSERQKGDYPKLETTYEITQQFNVKEKTQNAKYETIGYKLTNADKGLIIHAKMKQVGISKLAPYNNWEELVGVAKEVWRDLTKITGKIEPSKVSTRFINRIDIPATGASEINLGKYFRVGLKLPDYPTAPKLDQFSILCHMADSAGKTISILRLGTTTPKILDHVSVTLDIDVLTTEAPPAREEGLWAAINGLRGEKNALFEASITDKTRELFK